MRVGMVTYSLYESDNRVMRYAEALAARGDDVEVLALQKDDKPRDESIKGVRVTRIARRSFTEKRKMSFLKGVILFYLRAFWLISSRHLRRRYDLLHIHSIPDFLVFVAVIPKLLGAKVILDIHDILPELYASKFGVGPHSLGFRMMLFLERISARFSDHVIIANHLWRETLVSRAVAPEKCTVLLNYPDRTIFYPRKRVSSSERPVMLYPGTLNRHQGLDVAIRAFNLIKEEVPAAEFHIYGEGRNQDSLMKLVSELGLEGRVLFKPVLPLRDIASVMASVDIAVVPKRKDSFGNEAFSTKILELMSVGVPVIVSDTKIDKYYFDDSVVIFFLDGDEDDLASKMLMMFGNTEMRTQLVSNAWKFVTSFDWEVNKPLYLQVVDSLVRGEGAGVPEKTKAGAATAPEPSSYKRAA